MFDSLRPYGQQGSSVYGTLQVRTLEGVAVPSSRGPSHSRDCTHVSYVSCISRQVLYHGATWEDLKLVCSSIGWESKQASPMAGEDSTTEPLMLQDIVNKVKHETCKI